MDTSLSHSEESEENVRLIIRYHKIFLRQLDGANKDGQLDDLTYQRLKNVKCTAKTKQGIYDHFDRLFRELVEHYQERLRKRIYKGAQMLDSMGKSHPNYQSYMNLYDELCEELKRSEERGVSFGNIG